ncbi:THUMP domain-containing protein [soil metagenome]
MHSFNKPSRIIVTCNKWLAPYLEQEIKELNFKISRTFQTGVELNGTLYECIRLNLNLTCAGQVLYSLKAFTCTNASELYDHAKSIQWESIIAEDGYFSVSSNVMQEGMNNNLFANVKIKDAIADRFREKTGVRPNSGPEVDKTVIHLFWKNDEAQIFIDTSGETLAKHGYRKIPGAAPMLEALAAATVRATNWDRRSPFVNPMCGSSTVAIEAALSATNRKPGLLRDNYGFKHILGFEDEILVNEKTVLQEQIRDVTGIKIIATDHSEDAINISKINAAAAGIADLIQFEVCDFSDTQIPESNTGVVFFNPAYGERLGDEIELEEVYSAIGDFLKKKCKGYTGYIFTGNLELAKKIGLKTKKRTEFYNGKIDCRLLQYELYAGSKREA